MRRRDRDAARLLLRRRVDLVIRLELAEILRDRRRQRRLAVVNVTNRADVHMRLVALELRLRHLRLSSRSYSFASRAAARVQLGVFRLDLFGMFDGTARSGRNASCTARGPEDMERSVLT
jgi:hypothetical protein